MVGVWYRSRPLACHLCLSKQNGNFTSKLQEKTVGTRHEQERTTQGRFTKA